MTAPILPVRLMPDPEAVWIDYLQAMLGDEVRHVVAELWTEFDRELPVVQVTRTGGAMLRPLILDSPRIDVDVYAPTRAAASDLCRKVAAVALAAKGYEAAGGLITGVEEVLGPSYRPDVNPRLRHFVCAHTVNIRPTQ